MNNNDINETLIQSDEIDLRNIIRILKKRKFMIFFVFLLSVFLATVYSLAKVPVYKAESKVVIEQPKTQESLTSYINFGYDPNFIETQREIIKSKRIAFRVIDILDLENRYEQYFKSSGEETFFQSIGNWFGRFKESAVIFVKSFSSKTRVSKENLKDQKVDPEEQTLREKITQEISENLEVANSTKNKVFTISYESINPEVASLIVNAVVRAYLEEMMEMKMDTTRQTLGWMTKKAEEERQKLEGAEKRLQKYMATNDIITLEDRLAVLPQRLSELGSELTKAETERQKFQSLYELSLKNPGDLNFAESISIIADNSALKTLKEQIVISEKNITILSRKYGPKHPEMKKAVSDLETLKKKREEEIKRGLQYIKNNYDLSKSRVENLNLKIDKTKSEVLTLNEKFIQYGALKRDVETSNKLYEALITKIKEKSITEETEPISLSVIEKAQIPPFPYKPKFLLNIAVAIASGIMLGIFLAFFVEFLDNTIKDPEETERIIKLSVMTVIPFSNIKGENLELTVLKTPLAPITESYKSLRTSVVLSSADKPPKIILVGSSMQSEGKTTTAINLALSMAVAGQKVLLIDSDLRKPRIHKVFKLKNNSGLSNYLAGEVKDNLLQNGPLENLKILTSGPIPPNPSELISSNNYKIILENASETFDFIIIDTAPILAVADSVILSRLVDGVILVAKAHETSYDYVKKAIKNLRDVNAKILGLVINGLNIKKSGYNYNYYYYAYGEHPKSEKI